MMLYKIYECYVNNIQILEEENEILQYLSIILIISVYEKSQIDMCIMRVMA